MVKNASSFDIGDQVVIGITDMDVIRHMQEDHGGWNDAMEECLVGPCIFMEDNGAEAVVMGPSGSEFRLNSTLLVMYIASDVTASSESTQSVCDEWAVLTADETQLKAMLGGSWESSDRLDEMRGLVGQCVKVIQKGLDGIYTVTHHAKTYTLGRNSLSDSTSTRAKSIWVGDMVTLTSDTEAMKELQHQHGGWSNLMELLLVGQRVQVLSVFEDGDLHVSSYGTQWLVNSRCVAQPEPEPLKPGDLVQISSDIIASKKLQNDFGGWAKPMKSLAGKTGKIVDFVASGAARVSVGRITLHYNPRLLTRKSGENKTISAYMVGDTVQVIDDEHRVKVLQKGHGEWSKGMTLILGHKGTVKYILPSGDLQVKVMGNKIVLNPKCVVKADPSSDDDGPSETTLNMIGMFSKLLYNNIGKLGEDSDVDQSDEDSKEVSKLELAVLNDDYEMCYALVESGADVNALNRKGMTPIMYAAQNGNQDILRRLVQHPDAKLDIGDEDGDTALHVAVWTSRTLSVETLLQAGADMRLVNKEDFSAFHLAAKNGKRKILELFLEKQGPSLVDLQKDDKYAAIHLAALNNHPDCLRLLIQYKADINIRTDEMKTALHLAVCQKNMKCVQILVEGKAEINLMDKSRDTPLHYAIRVHQMNQWRESAVRSPLTGPEEMMQLCQDSDETENIVLYLVQNGAYLHIVNGTGKTPLDMCYDTNLKTKLEELETKQDWIMPYRYQVRTVTSLQREIEQFRKKIKELEKELEKCTECNINSLSVTFNCGHTACRKCSKNRYKCDKCGDKIKEETEMPYRYQVPTVISLQRENEQLRKRIKELEKELEKCTYCYINSPNVTFNCGHKACRKCAKNCYKCDKCGDKIKEETEIAMTPKII